MSEEPTQEQTESVWYAPVFILQDLRFVWFDRALVAETPERAKEIGLKLEAGYIKENLPVRASQTVAKFRPDGSYAMATLGPDEESRPVIVVQPGQVDPRHFQGDQAPPEDLEDQIDPVEEIPYDEILDDSLIKTARF